jgi:hypothetical protein
VEGTDLGREAARLIAARRWFTLTAIDQNASESATPSRGPFALVDGSYGTSPATPKRSGAFETPSERVVR